MKKLTKQDIAPGMRVVFIDRSLNRADGHPDCHVDSDRASIPADGLEGIVVAFGSKPGQPVCVVLKQPLKDAAGRTLSHECDGFAPKGLGLWARPEHLYTPESHAAHKAARAKVDAEMAATDKAKAAAHEIAKKFLEE